MRERKGKRRGDECFKGVGGDVDEGCYGEWDMFGGVSRGWGVNREE